MLAITIGSYHFSLPTIATNLAKFRIQDWYTRRRWALLDLKPRPSGESQGFKSPCPMIASLHNHYATRCGQVNSVSILIHLFTTADFSSFWVEYNSISACTSYYRIPYLYQSTYFQVSYLWISLLTPQLQLIFLFCLLNGINHPYLETVSITRRRHSHI